MPEETIKAYQDHGEPQSRLESDLDEAHDACSRELERVGVDYEEMTDTLEREGVEKFSASFEELIESLRTKQKSLAPA